MLLKKLSCQLEEQTNGLPPVELWNPPYCGEIDIVIKANANWFYDGSPIKRLSLVKLFASVLMKEENNTEIEYFLVTPVEKVKIRVEDMPFMITQWSWIDSAESIMQVTTNLDDKFILNKKHPLTVSENGDLYVTVRRNLLAKVHRNVYYQWVEIAQEQQTPEGLSCVIYSDGCQFSLGKF